MHDGDLRGSSLFCFLLKSLARHKFRHMHVYAPEKGSLRGEQCFVMVVIR